MTQTPRQAWLAAGLFFATLATLLLETLDARLLSVLTWYHLSFFAVSLAMLGMAGGAVYVFLNPAKFASDRVPGAVARLTLLFAASIPVSHVINLLVPLPLNTFGPMEILAVVLSTIVLAVPFAISGVIVTIALTRSGGAIGRLYACDLAGAALGCLLVVPLLDRSNLSSAVFVAGGAASIAAFCFARFAAMRGGWKSATLAGALIAAAILNTTIVEAVHVLYPKNRQLWISQSAVQETAWNSHSYVILQRPSVEKTFFWGGGKGVDQYTSDLAWLVIDGEAGTPVTKWDGDPKSLDWIAHDVTTLPYHVRGGGHAAIIGIGGGRDILAAIWGRSQSIVGIDVNSIMIHTLTVSDRSFANIASRPEVTLVHDDGRAYVTRTADRFDVIQMSLVDTWAATGAGAFTLSENGLYTLQAWRTFLDRLRPGGVLSVSRWFDSRNVSETNRLVSLGVAALLDRGVAHPSTQLILAVRGNVATLMISNAPFTDGDREKITRVAADNEFQILQAPWVGDVFAGRLGRIARSETQADLDRATADDRFDYRAPTDRRPYYFNMLKPGAFLQTLSVPKGGAMWGNLRATATLLLLLAVATVMVGAIIAWPLIRAGRPEIPHAQFVTTMAFFGIIGFGYMLIQIALLQRFSVYLGHPTYTLAIILFSMLLFTGLGSFVSETFTIGRRGRFLLVPALIGVTLLAIVFAVQPVIDRTIVWGFLGRSSVVVAFCGPLAFFLGCCFPLGVRLSARHPALVAWMWGVNGGCGVLASIVAVGVSMWVGIDTNFWIAAILYTALIWPMKQMAAWNTPVSR